MDCANDLVMILKLKHRPSYYHFKTHNSSLIINYNLKEEQQRLIFYAIY
jgi:hypothetical protein